MSENFQISNNDVCIRAVIWNDYYVDWEVMTGAYDFHFSLPSSDNQVFVENMTVAVNNPEVGPIELVDNKTKSTISISFSHYYARFFNNRKHVISVPIRFIKALLNFIKFEF